MTPIGAMPVVGAEWTDDGERRERRGLKHRSKKAVRLVPIPPMLVAVLRWQLSNHAPASDGRIVYDGPSERPIQSHVYRAVWRRARTAALSEAEQVSQVAGRPYDLRHFNASTLIMAGVDVGQVARRLGHPIYTLMTTYAHWIDTGEDQANAMIQVLLNVEEAKPLTSQNAGHGPSTGQRFNAVPIPA
ncbi:tyrosine-type recombinase/integrase [Nonomuraea endophytica]|uniref:Integrase n=1 Tax=Nonomuraea endophytica TaxID=714136 RepID=A0A7W8AE15_9ACTN|nr:tyrosine-type recombinase/integrase [Nonomuraea endophytica]MBB5083480.1 integrase [Nonomuraea endophytica]